MATCIIPGIRARERGPSRVPRANPPIGSCAGLRPGPGASSMPDRTAPDPPALDTSPLCGDLQAWRPLTIQVVSQSPLEPLWDALVRRYHYLGYQKLLGHRLKYLAFLQDRPVAALAFSAPARALRVRDQWIGWSAAQRRAHLDRVVNNSRFLILPWVPGAEPRLPGAGPHPGPPPAGLGPAVRDAPVARGDLRGSRPLPRHLLPGGQLARPRPDVRPAANRGPATCTMAPSRRSTRMS